MSKGIIYDLQSKIYRALIDSDYDISESLHSVLLSYCLSYVRYPHLNKYKLSNVQYIEIVLGELDFCMPNRLRCHPYNSVIDVEFER